MKQTNAIASLRQLCCSGLSKEIVIAEFLRAVPMLIPSNSNTFSVSNDKFYPTYSMSVFDIGDMAAIAPGIIADFHTPERQQRAIAWFCKHPTINDVYGHIGHKPIQYSLFFLPVRILVFLPDTCQQHLSSRQNH